MKYIISAILVFMVTAGISYAQTEEAPVKQDSSEKIEKPAKQERHRRMRSKPYSKRLNSLVARSSRVVSDKNQTAELVEIRDEVVASLVKKEREYRRATSQLLESLSNADFDTSKVKDEFKKTQDLQTAIFDEYLEGLSAIRKIIGNENYNALYTMHKGQGKKPKADGEMKNSEEEPKTEPEKKPVEENTEAK